MGDMCGKDSHKEGVYSLWTSRVEYGLHFVRGFKRFYMMISNAVEPMFLLYITLKITLGPLLEEAKEMIHDGKEVEKDAKDGDIKDGVDTGKALINSTLAVKHTLSTLGKNKTLIKGVKACVEKRYKAIAATGIGAFVVAIQSRVRQFMEVGKYCESQIGPDNIYAETGKEVPPDAFKNAYIKATGPYGKIGAVALLMGYVGPDQYTQIAHVVEDDAGGYLQDTLKKMFNQQEGADDDDEDDDDQDEATDPLVGA